MRILNFEPNKMKLKAGFILIAIGFLTACGTTSKITNMETSMEEAFARGEYEQTIQYFDRLEATAINNNQPIEDRHKIIAGKAAFQVQRFGQATQYLSSVEDLSPDTEAIEFLGISYGKTGESELEYQHWNRYLTAISGSDCHQNIVERLFVMETERGNHNAATILWNKIAPTTNETLLSTRLAGISASGKHAEALSFAEEILKAIPNHQNALFVKARHYYEYAEKRYQEEMTKYNRDPNFTAYAYLRRELRQISADYRTARDLFIQLHEISPENKNYMRYLKNTYLRLEMRAEAARIDQMLGE